MEDRYYALVGHWKMAPGLKLGMSVYEYEPGSAGMTHIGDYAEELRVGAQKYDPEHNRLYVVDEFLSQSGKTGGGSNVISMKLDKRTGALEKAGSGRTYGTNPSYCTVDRTGKYLLVTHHCTENFVTRLVKTENGYDAKVYHDLATLLLYRLDENGDIADIADAYEIHGNDLSGLHSFPHLHCVVPDPEKKFYVVCDKGLDKIYSFRIDYEHERLVKCGEIEAKSESEPRYCCFAADRPVFYSNCESSIDINVYELSGDGEMTKKGSYECLPVDQTEGASPSDIVLHPSGRFLYVSIRNRDLISVMEIEKDDRLKRIQVVSCGGVNPRGLCVAPDGRFLISANMQSDALNTFSIGTDGRITSISTMPCGQFPGNIEIIRV